MHQGHNIPWSILEKHFTFTNDDKRFTPPFTGLLLTSTPGSSSALKHFIHKLVSTIKEFSDTERKKYSAKIAPIPPDGKVFSDALCDKYPELLSKDIVLLYENEMSTLLMLAQHPEVNMARLHCHDWQNGPYIGFICSRDTALDAYMLFNTMEAAGCLMNGAYVRTEKYKWFVGGISVDGDSYGEQVMHKDFLRSCGLLGKRPEETWVHLHYGELQEYLKTLFAIIYRYDMLARETGIKPNWDIVFNYAYPFLGRNHFAEGYIYHSH